MSSKLRNKALSLAVAFTTVIWLTGGVFFIPVAGAQSSTDLQAQIDALLKQIAELQAKLSASKGSTSPAACTFTKSLTVGSRGDDVKCLQQYLNGAGFKVVASGPGSPGAETTYLGPLTRAAVAKWQAANGVSPAVGYFGSLTRAKMTSVSVPAVTPVTPAATPSQTPVSGAAYNFTRSLTIGSQGVDVKALQDYLISTGHFTYSGGSTGIFGPVTKTAVASWQAANGVSPASGYFGPLSKAKYLELVNQ